MIFLLLHPFSHKDLAFGVFDSNRRYREKDFLGAGEGGS